MSEHPQFERVQDLIAWNKRNRCTLPDCERQRVGFWKFCKHHSRAQERHGHPLGRKVSLHRHDEAKQYHAKALEFIRLHAQHPAIKAAVRFANRWLSQGAIGADVPAQRELTRLHAAGIKGAELVAAALAVWLVSHYHPHRLPDDQRLTYALANAVFALAPYKHRGRMSSGHYRYPEARSTDRRAAGEHIRRTLGVMLTHATQAIEAEATQKQEERTELFTPFTPGHYQVTPSDTTTTLQQEPKQ